MSTVRSPFRHGLLRRQLPLSRPHSFATTRGRRFHATAACFTSPSPPYAPAFRAKSIYFDSFPCTLHYYSSRGLRLALYDGREYEGQDDPQYLHQDRVLVGDNGLVDPAHTPHWNGAMMYPNTLLMLENTRNLSDWARECKMRGQDVATPWIFTIPKGTPLPRHLFLVHQRLETFHLMPREAKALPVLNKELNDFFSWHGSQMPEEEWASRYFAEGSNIYKEHEWMSR